MRKRKDEKEKSAFVPNLIEEEVEIKKKRTQDFSYALAPESRRCTLLAMTCVYVAIKFLLENHKRRKKRTEGKSA